MYTLMHPNTALCSDTRIGSSTDCRHLLSLAQYNQTRRVVFLPRLLQLCFSARVSLLQPQRAKRRGKCESAKACPHNKQVFRKTSCCVLLFATATICDDGIRKRTSWGGLQIARSNWNGVQPSKCQFVRQFRRSARWLPGQRRSPTDKREAAIVVGRQPFLCFQPA